MATLRTEEEKSAILAHCLQLEEEGGDILGYLWSQNYLTPRATWYNYQREWLGRKPYEFTDGKPKKKKEKTEMKKVMNAEEQAKAVRIAIEGEDPRKYLEEIGVADPQAVWGYIKLKYKEKHPDVYAKIPKRIATNGPKNKSLPKVDKGKPKQLELEGGKDYQLHVAETPEKPKITKPVNYAGMTVREVEGKFGRYRYSNIDGIEYIDFESHERMDTLSFTVEEWRLFRDEYEKAFMILGVEL